MTSAIPHSKPWLTASDVDAVIVVLKSNMIGQGALTRELEETLSRWVHAQDGVAVGSGSAALVLALHGAGVQRGDEVVLPTYVCPSVLEAVMTVGATPVLCDVGQDWVVTAECVRSRITSKTKAVIVAHMYGIFADVESFSDLGVTVIEDCAQAVDNGTRRRIAGDIAIFSLHPTKCLTSGEGGIAVSADPGKVSRMRAVRDGTGTLDSGRLFSPLSDLGAGLALSQLRRYAEALVRRRCIADAYTSAIESCRPESINRRAFAHSMFFRFPLLLEGGLETYSPLFLSRGIHVRRGVDRLLHRLLGLPDRQFPMATALFRSTVSLPIYPALTAAEQSYCVEHLTAVLSGGSRSGSLRTQPRTLKSPPPP